MGSVDWDSRLFDSLIPLPDGTSYNAYLIEGSEKTALLDTVDPPMAGEFMAQLEGIAKIDYIVSLIMRSRTTPEPCCRCLLNTRTQKSCPLPKPDVCKTICSFRPA
jgi:hypothetical protein